ncbi:MAG: hypothetical protein IE936_09710 [Moraxella osloensis]|nr:hypothetical protein [Moraxella osloensis]
MQRGQDVDKGIMNNATFLHVNRHSTDDDAAYIAQKLGVEVAIVPRKPLEFFQWTSDLGVVVAGRVDFENKPTAIWPNGVPRFIGKKAGAKSAAQLAIQSDGTFKGVQYR